MKRLRGVAILVAALGVLAAALYWSSRRAGPGYATPLACLDAYREACLAGDVDAYLRCLAEPLRSETAERFPDRAELAALLRRETAELKGWAAVEVEAAPPRDGAALVDVDQVRPDGLRRVRFHLTRSAGGWLITAIDPPRDVPADIPYGTHISETPAGSAPQPNQ